MRTISALALGLTLVACDNTEDPTDSVGPTDGPQSRTVQVEFAARVAGQPVACGDPITVGSTSAPAQLADARMFLSDVELRSVDDGSWVPLELEQDGMWQYENIALLDFEDGTAACADSGTSDLNTMIKGDVPEGDFDAIRFTLGVPFDLNHNDNATAPSPLNAPGMFWTWQGGYKFLRVDYMADAGNRWNVHIGSTHCDAAAPTEAPTACMNSNRAQIQLEGNPLAGPLNIDLDALVAGSDITVNTADTPPGCMSMPMEMADCGTVYSSLGLSFADGTCVDDCAGQALFVE